MLHWLADHAWWVAGASVAIMLIGALVGGLIIVRAPADHFTNRRDNHHPLLKIIRNVLGALLLLAGLAMSVPLVPGPGFILIIAGLSLMNFPGKQKFEMMILRRPLVINSINRLRAYFGRPKLQVTQ